MALDNIKVKINNEVIANMPTIEVSGTNHCITNKVEGGRVNIKRLVIDHAINIHTNEYLESVTTDKNNQGTVNFYVPSTFYSLGSKGLKLQLVNIMGNTYNEGDNHVENVNIIEGKSYNIQNGIVDSNIKLHKNTVFTMEEGVLLGDIKYVGPRYRSI